VFVRYFPTSSAPYLHHVMRRKDKNGQFRPLFSETYHFANRRTHSGRPEEVLIRIGCGKILRSVVTTTTPRLTRDNYRAAMASVAGTRVAAFN
jgi:hypothetical protein